MEKPEKNYENTFELKIVKFVHFKIISILGGFFVALAASAHTPLRLTDADVQAWEERKDVAESIQCNSLLGDAISLERRFEAMGMIKVQDGLFLPVGNKYRPTLFGDYLVAAQVGRSAGHRNATVATVYLQNQTGKLFAEMLEMSKIDEAAKTKEPSYIKRTGLKTTLRVGSASELSVGNATLKYQSSISCQVQ